MPRPRKYVAQLAKVLEVALHGVADLDFWTRRSAADGVRPTAADGSAQLVLTAVDAKWMRMPFRELSVSLHVQGELNAVPQDGIYLPQAFNSSRLLAFCERTFFRTPYDPANIQIDACFPFSIDVRTKDGDRLFARATDGVTRKLASATEESWEGPIYLPRTDGTPTDCGEFFWAKLAGCTECYPCAPSDTVVFDTSREDSIFAWLSESHFVAREWRIRQRAIHARSKTLPCNQA